MKKKSLLFLPILAAFALAGCELQIGSFQIGGKKEQKQEQQTQEEEKPSSEQQGEKQEGEGEGGEGGGGTTPEEIVQHATSMSMTPNAPFYLKVGETKNINVTLSPSPEKDEEKICEWTKSGDDCLTFTVDSKDTKKVAVTGVSAGTAKLTCTNTYNSDLTKTFTIKVIPFDESMDYLWQYQSSDRAQFGYIYGDNPAGDTEGDALLNGVTWHFTRSNAVTLQSSMGAIGFGRSREPETHIHLETENERLVNNFTIEAASAKSLAKMTIKVGDTLYMNEKSVPNDYYDVIQTIYSDEVTPAAGKIEIDIYTPEYDASAEALDETYKAPGAFFLKSLLINFDEGMPDKTMSLVKDASEIEEGEKYLIVGQYSGGFSALDGTLGSGTKDNPLFLEDESVLGSFALDDAVSVPGTFDKYGFTASFDENNKLNFTCDTGIKIGLSNSGLSTTKSPAYLGWDYSIEADNSLLMSLTYGETPTTKYFGVNKTSGKFSAYSNPTGSSQGTVYLYKF